MNNNMDTEDIKSLIIKKDEGHILRNKDLDSRLQGHFNIKSELLYTTDNCNNGGNIETGTQIDLQMVNINVKKEPRGDVHAKLPPSIDNTHCSAQKLLVKQEASEKVANTITATGFSSPFILQQNTSRGLVPEHEAKSFTPYCNIPIKLEVNDVNSESLDIKNESVDINNDGEMIQMENGCTNSGCSSQQPCLHTYRCSKCNLVFTEKQTFATHFKKCRLNKNSSTVPLSTSTSGTPHKIHECEHNNQNMKKLIENVRTNPCLYDMNNEDYNDIQLKDVIWANIACSCGFASGACAKAAWKKLKENFRDALTRQNNTLGHQTIIHNKVFKYKKHMEFLLPYISNNVDEDENSLLSSTIPDVNCAEETEEDDISIIQQLVSPAKKQKLMPSLNETLNTTNTNKRNREGRKNIRNNLKEPNVRSSASSQPLHMFFLSMCETTKNLPAHLQLQVKRRVFQAVIEAEEAAATLNNNCTNNNTPRASSSSIEEQCVNTVAQFSLDSLTNVIDNSASSSQED